MTSARRLITAVSLAAGAVALATPAAQASAPTQDTGRMEVLDTIDGLGTTGMPAEQAARMPHLKDQLVGVNRLNELNQLRQITDLVAPLTNLVPGIQ
ncbi:hypothetical protein AB0H82_02170 [Streptomyces sp. NPDC050732]|uniref:hypothetical protein n=1 Tax=Streptomyces sp. NPDC050732 TaxID=3154632 RepID=UPI003439079C